LRSSNAAIAVGHVVATTPDANGSIGIDSTTTNSMGTALGVDSSTWVVPRAGN